MNSIRSRIQRVLVGSIIVVGVCAVIILFVNQLMAMQSQKIIRTMTEEYSVISLSDDLIQKYNDAVKSSGSTNSTAAYQAVKTKLLGVIAQLKIDVVSHESKLTLLGVENTVNKVIEHTDTGLKEIQNNDLSNISSHFAEANNNNDFVRDNTRTLIEKELGYLTSTQADTNRLYIISIVGSLAFFVLIVFVMIIYSRVFSKQLVEPIEQLTKIVEEVAKGDMDTVIDTKLQEEKNEVGILAKSFVLMVANIKDKISELKISNEQASNAVAEMEKINSFMLDRETKMVDLKKRITELEAGK